LQLLQEEKDEYIEYLERGLKIGNGGAMNSRLDKLLVSLLALLALAGCAAMLFLMWPLVLTIAVAALVMTIWSRFKRA
jgi:hypothetical protein